MTLEIEIINQNQHFYLYRPGPDMKYSHDMQLDTITLEHLPTGAVTVRPGPEGVVAIVGTDGVLTTVFTKPGRLEVRVDVGGRPLWVHRFDYSLGEMDHSRSSVSDGPQPPTLMQRRKPGRPRKAPLMGEVMGDVT